MARDIINNLAMHGALPLITLLVQDRLNIIYLL